MNVHLYNGMEFSRTARHQTMAENKIERERKRIREGDIQTYNSVSVTSMLQIVLYTRHWKWSEQLLYYWLHRLNLDEI